MADGRDLRTLQRDEIARLVSYVPQAHGAFFPYTVSEVVLMGRTAHLGLFAAPSARDHGAALDAIRRMGIAHLADATYTRISGVERIRALSADGIGVLLSTHDPDHAFVCADRVAMLHNGGLLACGAADDVMTAAQLQQLYGVDVVVTEVALGQGTRKVCLPLGMGV
jgi:iron complex transport system ATP-binding protein